MDPVRPMFSSRSQRPEGSSFQTVPCALGAFVDARPELPTQVDRRALARGWLIYLIVMLAFAGVSALLREQPASLPRQAAVAADPAATHISGKFAH